MTTVQSKKAAPKKVAVKVPDYVLPSSASASDADLNQYVSTLTGGVADQTLAGWMTGKLSVSHGDLTNIILAVRRSDVTADELRMIAAAVVHASRVPGALTAFGASIPADNAKGCISRDTVSKWATAGRALIAGNVGTFTPKQVLSAARLDAKSLNKAQESRNPGVAVPRAIAAIRKTEATRKADAAKGGTPPKPGAPVKSGPTHSQTAIAALSLLDAKYLATLDAKHLTALGTIVGNAGERISTAIAKAQKAAA